MTEVKVSRTQKKRVVKQTIISSSTAVTALDDMYNNAYKRYYAANEDLKQYAGRTLTGDELKSAEELVIKMATIFNVDLFPIISFIAQRHPDSVKMAHDHNEWREGNIKLNQKPSTIE